MKNCQHLIKSRCKCPDVPLTDAGSLAVQNAEEINARFERDRQIEVVPEPKSKKKKAPSPKGGQPIAPWKQRALAAPTIEQQVLAALMDPEKREDMMKLLLSTQAVDNFAEFVKQAWHVIEPATELKWNWHHTLLCNVLQALFESWLRAGEVQGYEPPILNTAINVCPGALKSKITTVCFPVWVWLRAPGAKFVCLSVNEEVAHRDARAARDLIKSDWFQSTFAPKWKLKDDQDAISNYGNDAGGSRLSKPSGSAIVGLRGDFLLYDDPNSPDETESERELINKVWDDSIYTRVNSGQRSMRIGIQQRVGAGDWTDHVLMKQGHWSPENTGGWMNVVLTAEFEAERKYVMPEPLAELLRKKFGPNVITSDQRTVEGESIHPERFTKDYLDKERKRFEGTGNYAAQYQQRPALVGGNLIKNRYWSWYRLDGGVRPEFDDVPKGRPRPPECEGPTSLIKAKYQSPGNWDFDWVCISIDCAVRKTTKGSNWGLLAIAGKEGRRYVLDDRSQRGNILEILEVLRAMIKMWRPDKILIEKKAASEDLKLRLLGEMSKGDMPMIILEEVDPGTQGKEERLTTCLPTIANGMVFLLDGAQWVNAFVGETCEFPNGRHDDRVDALSMCLNHYYEPFVEDVGLPDW